MGASGSERSTRERGEMRLSSRMRTILWAVLDEYVEHPEPVSSQTVLVRSGLEVSSATVRNDMGVLEDLGLLSRPHTSSGCVPTDRAFRMYVDHVLDTSRPSEGTSTTRFVLPEQAGEPGVLMRSVAEALSRETGQLGFSFGAPARRAPLRELRFVRVSSERILAVLVYLSGAVHSRIVEETRSDQPALDRAAARLSAWVCGLTLPELRAWLESELAVDRARRDRIWAGALRLARAGTEATTDDEVPFYVGDRVSLLMHPEFEDVARLREILTALDEKERMLALLDQILKAQALRVVLGDELDAPWIRSCAMVLAPLGPPAFGGIGVIGPVRMRYDRVIPAVRSLSESIASFLG